MANVSIGGNVTDSVMVFGNDNYVVKIGDVHGGVVNIIKPSDRPKYSARSAPVTIRPRAFPSLLDRENEFNLIKKAVQISASVSVWGQQGIGKTSFIRYLAHTLDAGNFTNGVVYLNSAGLAYEDLLQALFDAFFDSDATYKPNTTEILHALQNIKALIFLDDLQIGRDESASLLNAAPSSTFILSSTERSMWGEGEIIAMRGLPGNEALTLFEKELSRPISAQEKPTALQICLLFQGHPLQILQIASLARESGKSLENLLGEITKEKTDNKSMAYMNMAKLDDSEKQVLALLAAAGGTTVSQEHVKGIFKSDDKQGEIDRLITLGLVQAHSPRYSITNALVSSISTSWDLSSWQDMLLEYSINWLSQQPAEALVEESSEMLIHTIKDAGERKKWRQVIQLGRALEKFMIYFKRWQTWSDILNLILTAAKALNDRGVQAWAYHQLGSRALYLGYASETKTFLSQALNIRQAIGDRAGMAITQHNLNTLNGIITPLKGNSSGCRKYLTYGCGGLAALTILAAITLLVINFVQPPNNIRPTEQAITLPANTVVPTKTPLPTGTKSPTRTPRATPTLVPVLLYDFVENADEAFWYEAYRSDGDEIIDTLEFFDKPKSPSPESYLGETGDAYAGWDYDVPLMNGEAQDLVLLTYPYYEYLKVFGFYEVFIPQPVKTAYLEIEAGYRDAFVEPVDGVIFRIYINEKVVFEEPYFLDEEPIYKVVPVRIFEGSNLVKIEVESISLSPYDYAAWSVIKLWDGKP